ncbi:MAG: KTSC domain-containing protein, partial [Alcaligenaceae bacterium]
MSMRSITLRCLLAFSVCLAAGPVLAEKVMVKYRGQVDLAPFTCEDSPQSSLVKRLCYDAKQQYVLVNLQGTWYHYCEVPAATV